MIYTCEAGDIHGAKCHSPAYRLINYVPAHLAGTADTLGSTRGLMYEANVCQKCHADLIENYFDASNVVRP